MKRKTFITLVIIMAVILAGLIYISPDRDPSTIKGG